jgi:K+-sensing histidine kinase KdpD
MSQSPNESKSTPETDLPVSMRHVIGFVRQLSHDLRNHLNAAELQSAFVAEVATDAEMKAEVQRLRAMISEMGTSLQRLTTSLATAKLTLMPYEAAAFVADLEQKVATQFPDQSKAIGWKIEVGNAMLEIDPQFLQQAFLELFTNAMQQERAAEPLTAQARIHGDQFVFTLSEPKNSFTGETENWGREPFQRVRSGHYGLGLHHARHIIEAHRGQFLVRHDQSSSSLVTTVVLPLAAAA